MTAKRKALLAVMEIGRSILDGKPLAASECVRRIREANLAGATDDEIQEVTEDGSALDKIAPLDATDAEVAVMIGNTRNGLWFGYATDTESTTVRLKRARQVTYYSRDCKGSGGLAANGPTTGCRISPPVPEVIVRDVCTVGILSPEAVAKFEAAPWAS